MNRRKTTWSRQDAPSPVRSCVSCGRRTTGASQRQCPVCLTRKRQEASYEPGDPVGAPRKPSRRKPYRLAFQHAYLLSCEAMATAASERALRKAEREADAWHFQTCLECQQIDRLYWSLDAADPRFHDWTRLMDDYGVVQPKAMYEVQRRERPILPFSKWCRFHGWQPSDHNAVIAYNNALHEIPVCSSRELGHEVWASPETVVRIDLL